MLSRDHELEKGLILPSVLSFCLWRKALSLNSGIHEGSELSVSTVYIKPFILQMGKLAAREAKWFQ